MTVTRALSSDRLAAIAAALRRGPAAAEAHAAELEDRGESAAARAARLMAAAVYGGPAAVAAELGPGEGDGEGDGFWRRAPDRQFLAVWTLFWSHGAAAALARLADLPARADALPASWREIVGYLDALRALRPADESERRAGLPPLCRIESEPLGALAMIRLAVEGRTGRFVVDSGAPGCLLSAGFARAAGLAVGAAARSAYGGGGERLPLHPAVARRIEGPGFRLSGVALDVAELSGDLGVDGIVSPLALWRGRPLWFDGPGGALLVGDPPDAARPPFSAPLIWSEGSPLLPARVGNTPLRLLLDSGAGANLLTRETVAALGLDGEAEALTVSPTAAGSTAIYPGGRLELAVGTAPPERFDYLVKPAVEAPLPVYPGLTEGYLGQPWFRVRRLRVAAERTSVSFSGPEGEAAGEGGR